MTAHAPTPITHPVVLHNNLATLAMQLYGVDHNPNDLTDALHHSPPSTPPAP